MKFDTLFNNVFITEAEGDTAPIDAPITNDTESTDIAPSTNNLPEEEQTSDKPAPDNYDVEPAPVATPTGDAGSIKSYLTKLEDFIETLNGVDGDSLQKLVTDIDRDGSLFQGISRETSSDIIKLAEQTAGLIEILKGFIINSAKRSRDISAGSRVNR